jgi:hypothetical protein
LLALAHYALVNEWCPCHLSDVCDSTLWPNLTFRCVFKSTIMSSFSWYNTWQCLMIELFLVVISSPPLLFSLMLQKVHCCSLHFLHFNFNFSPRSFIYYFVLISFVKV